MVNVSNVSQGEETTCDTAVILHLFLVDYFITEVGAVCVVIGFCFVSLQACWFSLDGRVECLTMNWIR